jgi:hypothetical protein
VPGAQVVYNKLSHNHRRELHAALADYYLNQQRKHAAWHDGHPGSGSEGGEGPGGSGSASGGADAGSPRLAAARVASADITPLLVHHLALAHREQKVCAARSLLIGRTTTSACSLMLQRPLTSTVRAIYVVIAICSA